MGKLKRLFSPKLKYTGFFKQNDTMEEEKVRIIELTTEQMFLFYSVACKNIFHLKIKHLKNCILK